ncbi:hypothetical protein LXA43DRAFT_1116097 [Ganoderma leucocontextum]|nr:hypothetical protein LXA43DRAFT_1116097 [Ganoderma leucocontextum]
MCARCTQPEPPTLHAEDATSPPLISTGFSALFASRNTSQHSISAGQSVTDASSHLSPRDSRSPKEDHPSVPKPDDASHQQPAKPQVTFLTKFYTDPTLNRHSPPEVVANFKCRVPPRLPKPRKKKLEVPQIPPPCSAIDEREGWRMSTVTIGVPMGKKPTLSSPPYLHHCATLAVPSIRHLAKSFSQTPRREASFSPSSVTSALPASERRVWWTRHKLELTDYLIKPGQQFKDKRHAQSVSEDEKGTLAEPNMTDRSGDNVVLEAMREMMSRVNRASETEAHNLRSAFIHSRLVFMNPPLPSPSSIASVAASVAAQPSAASSNPSQSGPVSTSSCSAVYSVPTSSRLHPVQQVKYLGAFLYNGGYCIFVKIQKGGRVYEPRHWFALSEVEVVDIEEDGQMEANVGNDVPQVSEGHGCMPSMPYITSAHHT